MQIQEKELAIKDLETIKTFLEEGRSQLTDNGFSFIFWGLFIPLVTAGFYLSAKIFQPGPWMNWYWPILMGAGSTVVFGVNMKEVRSEKKRTFLNQLQGIFWSGFLIICIIAMVILGITARGFTPVMMSILALNLGFAYWVYGSMLKMNWIRLQALVWWGCAVIMAFTNLTVTSWIMAGCTLLCSFGTGLVLQLQRRKG